MDIPISIYDPISIRDVRTEPIIETARDQIVRIIHRTAVDEQQCAKVADKYRRITPVGLFLGRAVFVEWPVL